MSRIGQQPIPIPDKVELEIKPQEVIVSGPKGSLQQTHSAKIKFKVVDQTCLVSRQDESRFAKAQHGLMRSLVANMVLGVTQGFEKRLEVVGIGYKVRLEGQTLIFNLGFSHEVVYKIPDGLDIAVDGNLIKINGISKQAVGQAAATVRSFKKPEPYKGKGIRYLGEKIRRKSGKGGKE